MKEQLNYYQNKMKFEMDSADLYESMNAGKEIVIIDTRLTEAYKTEHIPEAISLPHRTMTEQSTAKLNKETLYVTYCDGIGCNASTKGALKMTELGFCVKELIGGLDWWKRDGYQTKGLKAAKGKKIICGC